MSMATRGAADRSTTVCIDRYQDGEMQGCIYHSALPQGRPFHSAIHFLKEMELLLDSSDSPKAYAERRLFTFPQLAEPPPLPKVKACPTGQQATFALRVLFRQNAAWQGSITWLEGGQEQSFRSVLELLLLLDSALTLPDAS